MTDQVLVTPFDEHNQTLVDNVHPLAWNNPEPAPLYHLVVIGAGTAGLVAAAGAAGLGARVALVERHLMGGDCLNFGCVPSKALLRAARAWREVAGAAEFGLRATIEQADFGAAMRRVRAKRATISPNDSAARFRELGVDVFLGAARFAGPDSVEVDDARLRFHRALVATGTRPAVPEVEGLAEAGYLTNESLFSLQALPSRLLVVGGGPVGCEMAQAFARFGAQVTLLVRGAQLLPREEPEAARVVQEALEADGVRIVVGAELRRVERGARLKAAFFQVEEETHRLAVEEILIAVGRRPNVEGLDLEAAGIRRGERGIEVDDHLRTSHPAVWAAGDVCSRYRFTHAADAMARIALRNALFRGRQRASELVIPWCTYTDPEVAHVGSNDEELRRRGTPFETITVPLEENDRAIVEGGTRGFLRLHHRRGKGEILGATLVSEHAGETIGELVAAIQHGIGLGELAATLHPYPTQAEVVKRAADAWNRKRLTPFRRKLFGLWFRRLEKKALRRLATAAAPAPGGADTPPPAPDSNG
ncbi:MAG: mercuric reductase [Acidobacteria bacterium]|nr:mercuric reductase [Acidobacteriota bacterium]